MVGDMYEDDRSLAGTSAPDGVWWRDPAVVGLLALTATAIVLVGELMLTSLAHG